MNCLEMMPSNDDYVLVPDNNAQPQQPLPYGVGAPDLFQGQSDTVSLWEIRDLFQNQISVIRAFLQGNEISFDSDGKAIIKVNPYAVPRTNKNGERFIIDTISGFLDANTIFSFLERNGPINLTRIIKNILTKKFILCYDELGIQRNDREYILTRIIVPVYLCATRAIGGKESRERHEQKRIIENISRNLNDQQQQQKRNFLSNMFSGGWK